MPAPSGVVFEIKGDRAGLGRRGILHTPHGPLETPALLPVVNPHTQVLDAAALRSLGARMLITNAHILRSSADLAERVVREGVHRLLGFDGPIMTDSGAFQASLYGDLVIDPDAILDFQASIGVDIATVLDVIAPGEVPRDQAERAVAETIARARKGAERHTALALATTVQGSIYPDLRESCARELAGSEAALHPIGGVVRLLETYRFADLVEIVVAAKRGLHAGRPVHLFGAGHPMVFALATLLGCDLYDSSSYHKFARDGRMMFADGTRSLADIAELPCSCPVCSATTAAELREMPAADRERRLAEHNLRACFAELRTVRQALVEGALWELVETRCRAHPALLDGLRVLIRHADLVERSEPISGGSSFRVTGPESYHRPVLLRFRRRLASRYQRPDAAVGVLLSERRKPYLDNCRQLIERIRRFQAVHVTVRSPLGPVPLELSYVYPIAQSLVPEEMDSEGALLAEQNSRAFSQRNPFPTFEADTDDQAVNELEAFVVAGGILKGEALVWERRAMEATADWQFGKGAGAALLRGGKVEFVYGSTGRIRNIIVDGHHRASLRAGDGLLSLRTGGAACLREVLPPPDNRVEVVADAVPFILEGRNVMAGFVHRADTELRPGDECLVVGPEDRLLAVGRCVLTPAEMERCRRGVAARVREQVRL